MSKKFNIKNCPLCGKLLNIKYTSNPATGGLYCPRGSYYCSTLSDNTSHYWFGEYTQQFIIDPFLVKNNMLTGHSMIYYVSNLKFIMETDILTPDNPEKLLKRIKLLIPFL